MKSESNTFIDYAFAKAFSGDTHDDEVVSFLRELLKSARDGHLYLHSHTINGKINNLIIGDNSPIVAYNDCYYLRRNWEIEENIATHLHRINKAKSPYNFFVKQDNSLSEEQQKALSLSMSKCLTLITGGPGCGKTYLAKKIIETFLQFNSDAHIIIGAPTGRAANNLAYKDTTFGTLHALLGLRDTFYKESGVKPLIGDLIIIDECSMIDINLWSLLLAAIPSSTHLVLIGDPHQLPPVESGALFHYICKIESIPQINLTKTMRTKSTSIDNLAKLVKDGEADKALSCLENSTCDEIRLSSLNHIPIPQNLQACILTPFCKGTFGTQECNKYIDNILNENERPIIITKNDYHLNLLNGEIGATTKEMAMFKEKTFPLSLLLSYELAYAISVHKSQGCEFDNVIILLPEGSEIFGREMLYTAITRAKKTVTIYSNKTTFLQIVSHVTYQNSNLVEKFKLLNLQ